MRKYRSIFESVKQRVEVDYDTIIDKIAEQKPGQFVSMCYVNVAGTQLTRKKMDIDAMNNALGDFQGNGYDTLRTFGNDATIKNNPIRAVVSLTRYVLNWCKPATFKKEYGRYASARTDLNARYREKYPDFGIMQKDGQSRIQDTDWGVSIDVTNNDAVLRQNTAKARIKSKYFFITEDPRESDPNDCWNVTSPCDYNVARTILAKKSGNTVPSYVMKNFEDADREDYINTIKGLDADFRPREFKLDKVLYIIATVDGVAYYYINNAVKLGKNIGTQTKPINFLARSNELVDIAKSELEDAINASDENVIVNEDDIEAELESIQYGSRFSGSRRAINERYRRNAMNENLYNKINRTINQYLR